MDLQLTGKIAVVTGASRGIGLAITRTLHEEGAHVVAASRTRSPELDALAGDRFRHVPVDLMDPSAPAEVVAAAVTTFGGVDVLVNNAGGPPPGITLPRTSFLEASDEDWLRMFELNLHSAVRAIRATLPLMIERGGGSIVNVSSCNARQPSVINVDYGAAKAGLNNVSKVLSEEFGPSGVRVNVVSPGPVRTAWWTDEGGVADLLAARTGNDRDSVMTRVVPEMMGLATGRMAEPQEIADAVALLASPRSGSTTGAELVIDSGFVKSL